MRRTLSLLFLLCFAWAQAAAAACPMGARGEEAPAAHHDGHHSTHAAHSAHGAAQGAASVQAAEDPRPDAPSLVDCAMATSCGIVAPPSSDGDGIRVPLLVPRSPAWDADRYASPTLTADPPPPRAAVPN